MKLKYVIIFFFSLLMISISLTGSTAPIHLRFEGLHNIDEHKIRNVLLVKEGEELNYARLDESLNLLRRWGVFDTMSVDLQGNELVFHLEEAEIITAIELAGNFPFIENQIRKYLTLHVGDIYTPQSLEDQQNRILEFYRNHGFANTELFISERRRTENHGVDITFHIAHGDVIRFGKIDITGNKAFPDGRAISFLHPYRSFSDRQFRHSLRDLAEFYHLHGYPKAHVKVLEKNVDFEKHRVNITLQINEGPRVQVKFYGNKHMKRRSLLPHVSFFREGSVDPGEQEASIAALSAAYRERGFPDVNISLEKQTAKNGDVIFSFFVKEGRAEHIAQLHLKGIKNTKLVKKIQQNLIHQRRQSGNKGAYLPEYVPADTEMTQKILIQEGYPSAHVGTWTVRSRAHTPELSVIIPVELGERQLVHEVVFEGTSHFSSQQLFKESNIRQNDPYSEFLLHDATQNLARFFADHGYPYAQIEFSTEEVSAAEKNITFHLQEGPFVHVGQILIVGDVLSSQKAIKKAMKIREGEVFSQRKILEAEFNLRRVGAFSSTNIEILGLESKSDIVHLRVKVEEQAPFLTDLEFGYSTDDQYTAALRFTNLNAFGWAKRNTLALVAGRELSRAELGWVDPRFLSSNVEMGLSSWIQYETKRSFTYIQLGGATSWYRRYQRLGFLSRVELNRNHFLEGDSIAADSESLRDNTLITTTGSVSFDQRDNFSDPKKGLYEVLTLNLLDEIRGNNAHFLKAAWSQEYNYSPFRFLTFSSSLRMNRAQPLKQNVSIPSNELYQLGGDDTIRGFEEDRLGPVDANNEPTGGRSRWIFNQELRLRSSSGFALGAFYDMGDLVNDLGELGFKHARHSAGLGLRYLTPVGPIRADYGFKLDRKPGENRGRFHFTFGYSF